MYREEQNHLMAEKMGFAIRNTWVQIQVQNQWMAC